MTVRITYCQPCRFFGPALTDLQGLFIAYNEQIEAVELVAGSGGVYDVEVDSELVFSKDEEGRFPESGELVRLAEKQAPTA